jgi:aquaporin Z
MPGAAGQQPRPQDGDSIEETAEESIADLLRYVSAELLGTFALTLVAAGGEVIAAISHGEVSPAARVVAPGLLVLALIYAYGNVSGAHFNPAVTLAFAARGDFPWRRVPGYWLAQFAGALLAALFLRGLFGTVAHLGATLPHFGVTASLTMEIVLSCLLITVILGTSTRHRVVGPDAALGVGATIALCGLFAGPVSGASMNPARSLGPAAVSGALQDAWIYLVGPAAGSLLAVGIAWVLHGRPNPAEVEAAMGDQKP